MFAVARATVVAMRAPVDTASPARTPSVTACFLRERTLRLALVVVLLVHGLRLVALWLAGASQAASGPANPESVPTDYFVFRASGPHPALDVLVTNWDGQWYERIATSGYPSAAQIESANDAWVSAFPPLFPLLTRAVMEATGLSFGWSALLLNTVATVGASALLYALLRHAALSPFASSAGAVGLSLLPSAAVLGVAYSEALALLLLVLTLLLVRTHRYGWATLAALGLALTRPIAVVLVLVVLVHVALRRRSGDRPAAREVPGLVALGAVSLLSPWIWPRLAAALFGTSDRATSGTDRSTQAVASLGTGWFGAAAGAGAASCIAFGLLLVLLALPIAYALRLRLHEPAAWAVGYLGLVLLVTPVTFGFVRYVELAGPALVSVYIWPALRRNGPVLFVAAIVLGLSLWAQWGWIRHLFVYDGTPSVMP